MIKTLVLIFLVVLCVAHEDGYHNDDFDDCMQEKCSNATATSLQKKQCKKQCMEETQREGSDIFRIVLIVAIVIFLLCVFTGLGCLCKKPVMRKWGMWNEKKRRKPASTDIDEEKFDTYLSEFQTIFTESERSRWKFGFKLLDIEYEMQWFSLVVNRVGPFEAEITIKGQDHEGVWEGSGTFVNTEIGVMAWWFKQYEGRQSFDEDNNDFIVFQIQRQPDGTFEGRWYHKDSEFVDERSGECYMKRKGPKLAQKHDSEGGQINYELISMPDSDVHL